VLPGVTIGKGTIVGANLWFQKVTDYVIAVGAPGYIKNIILRIKKWEKI
jgi:acetyltransferase-like isoleucine patch superfamily enzyme